MVPYAAREMSEDITCELYCSNEGKRCEERIRKKAWGEVLARENLTITQEKKKMW